MKKAKELIVTCTFHQHYLQYAFDSLMKLKNEINLRNIIEVIRYSYDCLEATAEFIFDSGINKQFTFKLPDNWLAKYIERKWNDLKLSDRLALLSYSWKNEEFWKTKEQFQLFVDLKKMRDGLTHPGHFIIEREYETKIERPEKDGTYYR
jgi:hypothetical protein